MSRKIVVSIFIVLFAVTSVYARDTVWALPEAKKMVRRLLPTSKRMAKRMR